MKTNITIQRLGGGYQAVFEGNSTMLNYAISRQFRPASLINEAILEKLSIRSSTISELVRFPVLNHTTFGGAPLTTDF